MRGRGVDRVEGSISWRRVKVSGGVLLLMCW